MAACGAKEEVSWCRCFLRSYFSRILQPTGPVLTVKTYKFAKMSDRVVVTSTKRDKNHDDSRYRAHSFRARGGRLGDLRPPCPTPCVPSPGAMRAPSVCAPASRPPACPRRRSPLAASAPAIENPAMAQTDAVAGRPNNIDELDMDRGACAIAPKYSPILVRERALDGPVETLKTLARGLEIVTAAGTFASGLLLDNFRRTEDVVSRSEQLRIMLADLGPSFVKAGQVLANRPDIVRADYMEQLTKLQDDVPAFPSDASI